jgi:uncharacterized membrane protein YphA (DoxX/SURF4 family)
MIKTGRYFYATALVVYGIQQFVYGDFRNVFFPPWQSHLPVLMIWAYIFGICLIGAGSAIIFGKKAREASLILGGIFLFLFCFLQIPYELISEPNKSYHLGVWADALKELALAGGAFVVAGSFPGGNTNSPDKPGIIRLLEKFIPLGAIFFCFTMATYGIGHFLYAEYMTKLLPAWVPDHMFWVYFTGVALTGAGSFIILNIRTKVIATLLGMMIFLWIFIVHLPRAIANTLFDRGNEVSSTCDALAFSGIAFLIAFAAQPKENRMTQ